MVNLLPTRAVARFLPIGCGGFSAQATIDIFVINGITENSRTNVFDVAFL